MKNIQTPQQVLNDGYHILSLHLSMEELHDLYICWNNNVLNMYLTLNNKDLLEFSYYENEIRKAFKSKMRSNV